ncbi:4-(cytidine 5'-diphospho)-2-C-methyl-D-erythritol kinase, partial [Francisella tularensis subsp. holarctica]|nr:4-(cytidine 5'-diphospho)-2-C-methyl-D-erythritol kinase [Francisella tularensis subsp. holarctica]
SPQYALLFKPDIHISTKEFFTSEDLIKSSVLISKDLGFDKSIMNNDFENVFYEKYPEFIQYLKELDIYFIITVTVY